jgi:uncharacterized protein (DUF1810 family)
MNAPFALQRFVAAQEGAYSAALTEMGAGPPEDGHQDCDTLGSFSLGVFA